ncbi:hypothetical protein D3C81_696920 [compost metagenome]
MHQHEAANHRAHRATQRSQVLRAVVTAAQCFRSQGVDKEKLGRVNDDFTQGEDEHCHAPAHQAVRQAETDQAEDEQAGAGHYPLAQLLTFEKTSDLVLQQDHADGVAGEQGGHDFHGVLGITGHQQVLRQVKGKSPVHHGAEQATGGEQDQGAVVFQGDQGFEETLPLAADRRARRVLRDPGHQENTEKSDGRSDQEGGTGKGPGNQHTEHRPDSVANVGQRIAQGKRLGALTHREVVAEDRFRTDEEQR